MLSSLFGLCNSLELRLQWIRILTNDCFDVFVRIIKYIECYESLAVTASSDDTRTRQNKFTVQIILTFHVFFDIYSTTICWSYILFSAVFFVQSSCTMDVEKLISTVFRNKCLWDMKNKKYHNRNNYWQNWGKNAQKMNINK